MRLKWLPDDGSTPDVTRYYSQRSARANVPTRPAGAEPAGIRKALSLRPDVGYHLWEAIRLGHFDTTGYLSQDTKQMVATYTSALRSCVY